MFINKKRDLAIALQQWQQAPYVGLDTEFIRERTYFPELCLVQLSIDTGNDVKVFAIDAIAFELEAEYINESLKNWHGTVIAHSMSQDVEILANTPWMQGEFWYDTQIAAALLGSNLQIGYASLVEEVTGVQLDKGSSRTDWTKRPLSSAQLHYALDDVRYLNELQQFLSEKLGGLGRSEWLGEDSNRLFEKSRSSIPNEKAYKRLKGFYHQTPIVRKRARYLATWREERAIALNRPRGWILKDDVLWQVANADVTGIDSVNGIPEKIKRPIYEVIEFADARDFIADDERPLPTAPSAEEKQRMKNIKEIVNEVARGLNIESNVLLTRSEMDQIAFGKIPERLNGGWRQDVLAEPLATLMPQNGEITEC